MDARDWILKQLNLPLNELLSRRREKDLVDKRRVVIWFFHKMGLNGKVIGRKINKERSTVTQALQSTGFTIKALAENLLHRYITEVLHEVPDFEPIVTEKVTIKIPDYKNNTTITKQVNKDEIKPIRKIRKWEW